MAIPKVIGTGTVNDPWNLKTPLGTSEYQMNRNETSNPPALVCIVGTTKLSYLLRWIEDLHAMLKQHGDWMLLGSVDEQKPAVEELWRRGLAR
jgi:hypothetical protein